VHFGDSGKGGARDVLCGAPAALRNAKRLRPRALTPTRAAAHEPQCGPHNPKNCRANGHVTRPDSPTTCAHAFAYQHSSPQHKKQSSRRARPCARFRNARPWRLHPPSGTRNVDKHVLGVRSDAHRGRNERIFAPLLANSCTREVHRGGRAELRIYRAFVRNCCHMTLPRDAFSSRSVLVGGFHASSSGGG